MWLLFLINGLLVLVLSEISKMVINRREIKRKHKDNSGTTNNVLESPKRCLYKS